MANGSPTAHGSGPLDRDEIVAHASFVRGVARGLLANVAAADDVAQETLLKLLKAAPARANGPRALKAWLVRSVRNLAIQWRLADVRRATREEGSTRRDMAPATDALVQRMELHRRVVDATLALDEGQRAVVLLHYFDELPMAEVAQRLGVPLETARTRLKKALERLRARLEAESGGREPLLLALLPVAGWELPAAAGVAVAANAVVSGGGLVAGGLVTSLGAPLVMTTVGKLAVAAAPLVAIGAWWMLQGTAVDPAPTSRAANTAAETPLSAPAAAGDVARNGLEVAARQVDAPPAPPDATDAVGAIDAALAAAGLGTVRVHVFVHAGHGAAADVGVRVVPETEPHALTSAVRGSTNGDGLFVAQRVRAGWCVAALAGFDTLPHWRWEHPDTASLDDAARAETPAGDSSASFKLAPGATRDVELTVPKGRRVDGRVLDNADRPIAGASIWVSDVEMTPSYAADRKLCGFSASTTANGQVVATSDAAGRFELPFLHQNTGIAAFAPGFAMSQKYELIGLRDDHCTLTLRLEQEGTTLNGRVVTPDGAPIANAVVSVGLLKFPERQFADGILRQDPAPRRERSGADGRFTLVGAPLAPAQLAVVAAGFAPSVQSITLSAAGANDVVVTLTRGGTLTGSVHDDAGAAVAGVEVGVVIPDDPLMVNLDPMGTRSDAHGEFTVDHLPGGTLRAVVANAHGDRPGAETRFTVASNETFRWDAVVTRGRPLIGRVVDERGKPLVHWQVVATPQEEGAEHSRPLEMWSDAQGRFEFAGCADVDHELSAQHPEALGFTLGVSATARPGGGEVVLTVSDAELPKCSITGTLRVPDGFSSQDAMLDVTQLGGPGTRTTLVGAIPHRFYAGPFPAGRFAVSMRISRLPTRDFGVHELKPGEDLDLGEVVFERPARVVVHARRADGSPVDAKELRVMSRDSPDRIELTPAGANLEAAPLDAGRYVLCCDPSSASFVAQPFECAAGQQLELTVTLEHAALRVFRFKAAARAPDRVTIRCLDESGAELWAQTIAPGARGVLELRARFTIGKWTLEATASDSSRADFDVEVATLKDEESVREIVLR